MTDNKKSAPVWQLEAALKSFCDCHFNQFSSHIKAAIYKLTPWLFFVGVLHG
ncbi:hypothetical protein ACQE3E_15450 [Methylomonas sp. MED-D]|uniref:hypothetical protein n=1 Tax=Methylomonas sp. MED-D TaxID=3418768 RepID=UPI003CFF5801